MIETCSRVPSAYADLKKCWYPKLPPVCPRCDAPLALTEVPWWQICHACARIYIQIPQTCRDIRGWDQKDCCQICHGRNLNFENQCRLYYLVGGQFADVCCTLANRLKQLGLIRPDDFGVGIDGFIHTPLIFRKPPTPVQVE
jgi:hypothetical protein